MIVGISSNRHHKAQETALLSRSRIDPQTGTTRIERFSHLGFGAIVQSPLPQPLLFLSKETRKRHRSRHVARSIVCVAVLNAVGCRQFFKFEGLTFGLVWIGAAHLGPFHALGAKRPDGKYERVQVPARAAVSPNVTVDVQKTAPEKRAVDLVVKADAVVAHRNGCGRVEFLKDTLGKIDLSHAFFVGRLRRDAREHAGHHSGQVLHRRTAIENIGLGHRFKLKRRAHTGKLCRPIAQRIQPESLVVVPIKSCALRHFFCR